MPTAPPSLARDLASTFPALRPSADEADRTLYARDLWPRHHMAVRGGEPAKHKPGVIVWPSSTEDVGALVRWAAPRGVALVPFGAGSGVCGGVLPREDVVVVDLKRMGRIRALDRDAPSVDVEAGHMGVPLETTLGRAGFTLGHFPSSILCSTVGGWVAARSAGQCSGAYGKIEDMTASLECVTGTGDVVTLHRRLRGPDLTPLVIGSEGTLGVVTSARLRLHPAPATRAFASWSFRSTKEGWEALRAMFQAGLRPAVSRLYDPFDAMLARRGRGGSAPRTTTRGKRAPGLGGIALRAVLRRPEALNELLHSGLAARAMGGAMLVVIFEGVGDAPRSDLDRARQIVSRAAGTWSGEGPARRWLVHRYSVSYRQAPVFARGAFVDTMEVAARWSRLEALYDGVRRALGRGVFVMAHFSHAYPDGCCIYFSFAGSADPALVGKGDWEAACEATYDRTWNAALAAAIESGGTLSHHHGVGRSKAPRLEGELGAGADVVRDLMRAFDPSRIFNPGSLLPPSGEARTHATPRAPGPGPITLDEPSLLACIEGGTTLNEAEQFLQTRGLTLGLERDPDTTPLAAWLSQGAPGARDPWRDPADHLLAGFDATLAGGRTVSVRPAPRRAVGPDLAALFVGMKDRYGKVDRAWMRVHRASSPRYEAPAFRHGSDPAVTPGEEALMDAINRAATPSDARR